MKQDTYSMRQRAICETALAYHLKGESMQYDSAHLTYLHQDDGGIKRQSSYVSPEDATPDHTLYTVCSSFAFEVYWEALRYPLMGAFVNNGTHNYFDFAPKDIVVFRWDQKTDTMRREEAVEKLRTLMEPGDAVVGLKEKTGHIMLYCGDIDGDGISDLIHSSSSGGGKYNIETGEDKVELGGDIRKNDAFSFLFRDLTHLGKGHCYWLGRDTTVGILLLRPLLGEAGKLPLTQSARGRLRYPMLTIDRTVSTGEYGAVPQGGSLTYCIRLKNHGKAPHRSIPVTEEVPEGTSLLTAPEAVQAGTTLLWSVDLQPGEEKILQYTVTVTAPKGTEILCDRGSVAGIRSNRLGTLVCGEAPALDGDWTAYLRKADKLLPTLEELFAPAEGYDVPVYHLQAHPALIRHYFGGRAVVNDSGNSRILEHRRNDLSVGDVIRWKAHDGTTGLWVCTGTAILDASGSEVSDAQLVALHTNDFFAGLRLSQL